MGMGVSHDLGHVTQTEEKLVGAPGRRSVQDRFRSMNVYVIAFPLFIS